LRSQRSSLLRNDRAMSGPRPRAPALGSVFPRGPLHRFVGRTLRFPPSVSLPLRSRKLREKSTGIPVVTLLTDFTSIELQDRYPPGPSWSYAGLVDRENRPRAWPPTSTRSRRSWHRRGTEGT